MASSKVKDKKIADSRKKVLALLNNLFQDVTELTIPQILVTLMRRKGGDDPYHWTDEQLSEEIRKFQLSLFENPLDKD